MPPHVGRRCRAALCAPQSKPPPRLAAASRASTSSSGERSTWRTNASRAVFAVAASAGSDGRTDISGARLRIRGRFRWSPGTRRPKRRLDARQDALDEVFHPQSGAATVLPEHREPPDEDCGPQSHGDPRRNTQHEQGHVEKSKDRPCDEKMPRPTMERAFESNGPGSFLPDVQSVPRAHECLGLLEMKRSCRRRRGSVGGQGLGRGLGEHAKTGCLGAVGESVEQVGGQSLPDDRALEARFPPARRAHGGERRRSRGAHRCGFPSCSIRCDRIATRRSTTSETLMHHRV